MYRIYITEGFRKFYLMDIIIHDDMEHPQFGVDWSHAMTFPSLYVAMDYRKRLIDLGYQPHIV